MTIKCELIKRINKTVLLRLIIGLIMLIPTTYYLLCFYISTFHYAFFFSYDWNIVFPIRYDEMLVLSRILETGGIETICILCIPFFIMFLGGCVNIFAFQKSWIKYLKITVILCIVLSYDSICAYMIGKHICEMEIIVGLIDINYSYGFAEAFSNINIWVVIFIGFMIFVIWSVIFGIVINAYKDSYNLRSI